MPETERKVSRWLDRGQHLTRNDLADFLAELDAAGASGDTVVEVRTAWLSGAVRGLFATAVTRGDPVPLPDPAADWEALARGDDSRPPFPGGRPDWYDPTPTAGLTSEQWEQVRGYRVGRLAAEHDSAGPERQDQIRAEVERLAGPFEPAPRPDQVQPSMTRDDDGLWA